MSEKRSWLEQDEEDTRTVCAVCGDKGGVSLPSQSGWVFSCDHPATIMCLSACNFMECLSQDVLFLKSSFWRLSDR